MGVNRIYNTYTHIYIYRLRYIVCTCMCKIEFTKYIKLKYTFFCLHLVNSKRSYMNMCFCWKKYNLLQRYTIVYTENVSIMVFIHSN